MDKDQPVIYYIFSTRFFKSGFRPNLNLNISSMGINIYE